MTVRPWGGRRVQRLARLVVEVKGSTCWLCGEDGADSPDHDPPRSQLVRDGVPDPDDLRFLNPAHRLCNVWRKDRPVTAILAAEIRARRRSLLAETPDTPSSPVVAARRPSRTLLFETPAHAGSEPFPVPPRDQEKNGPTEDDDGRDDTGGGDAPRSLRGPVERRRPRGR